MLIPERRVIKIFRAEGVRESVRTLTLSGRLVRVVTRRGVHYLVSDVQAAISEYGCTYEGECDHAHMAVA